MLCCRNAKSLAIAHFLSALLLKEQIMISVKENPVSNKYNHVQYM